MDIIIDIDDVIADLLPQWLYLYNHEYDEELTPEDITDWDMTLFCRDDIYKYLELPNLYDFVQPIEGAYEGVVSLANAGHKLHFITAKHHPSKLAWMRRHKFFDLGDYIVLEDKSKFPADLIIDDRPETVLNFPQHAILFDRPHNRKCHFPYRMQGWSMVLYWVSAFQDTKVIEGVGKDAPMCVNENGGKQSKLDYRFDLFDPMPLFQLANIVATGAEKYGEWNWRRISVEENLNHALCHIFAHLAGDEQDDHLGHAFCRLMFALSVHLNPQELERMKPE
jgi:5'-nucleotidase